MSLSQFYVYSFCTLYTSNRAKKTNPSWPSSGVEMAEVGQRQTRGSLGGHRWWRHHKKALKSCVAPTAQIDWSIPCCRGRGNQKPPSFLPQSMDEKRTGLLWPKTNILKHSQTFRSRAQADPWPIKSEANMSDLCSKSCGNSWKMEILTILTIKHKAEPKRIVSKSCRTLPRITWKCKWFIQSFI